LSENSKGERNKLKVKMDKNFEILFEEENRIRIALELEFAEYRGK